MDIEQVQGIPGALIGTPKIHDDPRGSFHEIFRESDFGASFVQANHSRSRAGVLRGLHYHRKQADAWYVFNGDAQAMLADLRTPKPDPAAASVMLSAEEPRVLYIPPGVAHGFLAITDLDLMYWVTHYYDASDEFGVAWDDPTLDAPWETNLPILSDRDKDNPKLDWDSIDLS